MVLRRKAYQHLLDWKNTDNGATALLINGARRVGKSHLCKYFAQNEYRSSIIVDFANAPKIIRDIIDNDSFDLDLFFAKLSSFYNVKLNHRESLIVFDEVQLFPRARQLIKYLVADGRYDYIETGSLISLKKNVQDILIPSEEEHYEMYPLDFEEFLWALGDELTVPFLKQCFDKKQPLGQALHRKIMNDFRQYILVGGMPQVVVEYLNKKDFAAADKVKRRILSLYRSDITKYAGNNADKVNSVFDTLSSQLEKKEKKYTLSAINKDARLRSYEDSFLWLGDAMIANPCYNATDPNVGLAMSGDHSTQKLYFGDTGLLVTQAFSEGRYNDNELYRAILLDKLSVNEGMLMENIVAQSLRANGRSLYFYSRYDSVNRDNMMEVDFLIRRNKKISPLEVKSSVYTSHSSLGKFKRKFASAIGESYILYPKDVMVRDGVIHLPLYMAMLL